MGAVARASDCDDSGRDAARQDASGAPPDYDASMVGRCLAVGIVVAALVASGARASTLVECAEGADFIANAAASRDNRGR